MLVPAPVPENPFFKSVSSALTTLNDPPYAR